MLISMHATTQPMRAEALSWRLPRASRHCRWPALCAKARDMGSYESPWGKHAKVQLLTVSELLEGKRIDMPPATGVNVTFKKAPKKKQGGDDQLDLAEEED